MLGFLCSLLVTGTLAGEIRLQTVQERTSSLSKTWSGLLDNSAVTPVTRAVNLLKEMEVTLKKDMEEDEGLYDKLACWCADNTASKKQAIEEGTKKIAELEASIEEGTSSSANLKAKIKELEAEVADNKETLGKASALRQKELTFFNSGEKDAVANIANLKSAIVVLSKHHGAAALPQLSGVSFIQSQSRKDEPYGLESQDQRDLDMFMSDSSAITGGDEAKAEGRFLQQATAPKVQKISVDDGWTFDDVSTIKTALRSASAFVQKRGQDASNVPAYDSQSGEIFGVLRQLKEDMEADLSDSQKTEAKRAGDFNDLRAAKTAEIEGGEKSSEEKEDELSKTDNDLAEAKEDLGETEATLAEDTKFAKNLKKTCDEADANFAERKQARLAETQAVSEAIEILSEDEAKSAFGGAFKDSMRSSFIQLASKSHSESRRQAAKVLRRQASISGNEQLALLATSTEIDAFTKVNGMIDKMVETLNTQQADEVKRNDWCNTEIQSNDMDTMKAKDREADLSAGAEERRSAIKKFEEDVGAAKTAISKEQVSLQKATINRKKENLDFQKTIADQTLTIKVLAKAMDRLATFYDNQALIQTSNVHSKQTPPVPQATYKPSMGSGGVLSLIEKLVYDAKEIMAESKKAESDAQAAYEEMVSDSNGSIKALTKSVLSKTDAKVEAHKDLTQKVLDLKATDRELTGLSNTDKDLHDDCDYLLKNFTVRQEARAQEVEALKQAKSILSGASA